MATNFLVTPFPTKIFGGVGKRYILSELYLLTIVERIKLMNLAIFLQVPGDFQRLAHVISMAQRGLAVRVAVIGGSVTHGNCCESYALPETKQGAPGLCSWAHRFVEWLKEYHQNPNIELFNLGVQATLSAWHLSHFDEVLEVRPDLLIVDYGASICHTNNTCDARFF